LQNDKTSYFSIEFNVQRVDTRFEENDADNSDEEIEIEIIEVEEPEEPVPMQDSCLQVCENFFYYGFELFGRDKNIYL
jgi:hypothetical protein